MPPTKKEEKSDVKWAHFIDILKHLALPLAVVVSGGWIGHEVRLARVEETRFTNVDGAALESRMKSWVEARYPPDWLMLKLDEIRGEMNMMNQRLRELEKRP